MAVRPSGRGICRASLGQQIVCHVCGTSCSSVVQRTAVCGTVLLATAQCRTRWGRSVAVILCQRISTMAGRFEKYLVNHPKDRGKYNKRYVEWIFFDIPFKNRAQTPTECTPQKKWKINELPNPEKHRSRCMFLGVGHSPCWSYRIRYPRISGNGICVMMTRPRTSKNQDI